MGHLPKIVGPGKGFDLANVDFFVTNATGAATVAGDVVAMTPVATGILTTYRVPISTDFRGLSWIGVALENIAIGGTGRIRFRGQCKAFTLSTGAATTISVGLPYTVKAGSVMDIDTPSLFPRKWFALALDESSGAASATKALRLVLLDGIDGFGTVWTS